MSNSIPSNFDLGQLVAALDEDLQTQMDFLSISPQAHTAVQRYLVSDLQSVRFSILADMLSISDLWKPIREQGYLVDLLLELTSSLHLHAEARGSGGWAHLCQLISAAVGSFNHSKIDSNHCALDNDDERERYAEPDSMALYINSNPWLVTLYLLRRTEGVRKMIREVAGQAQRTAANPPRDP